MSVEVNKVEVTVTSAGNMMEQGGSRPEGELVATKLSTIVKLLSTW